jgi:dipeptidyl aminopeptidase/acylaminoacyl peptidase
MHPFPLAIAFVFAGVAGVAGADTPAATASPRAITHEDLWTMPRVGAPVASPDGRSVLVPVAMPAYAADASSSDLWLLDVDGQRAPRRLTFDAAVETSPTWSRNGRHIAFSAKRPGDAEPQIYVLDLHGGDALRATSIATGARLPQFSPDGRRLLFVSQVEPGLVDEASRRRSVEQRAARKTSARVYTGFPIRNWDKWLDERQPHLFVQTLGEGEARDLLASTALAALPGFGGRVAQGIEELDPVWTPDGRGIVFVASRNRDRGAWAFTHTDLWLVSVDGGEPRRLSGDDGLEPGDSYSQPRFSADGSRLLALVSPRSASSYNAERLEVLGWPDAKPSARIEAPRADPITSYVVSSDGGTVWFGVQSEGRERVFRSSTREPNPRPFARAQRGNYSQLSGGGTREAPRLVALHDSAQSPAEVVRLGVADDGRGRRIRADAGEDRHRFLTSFSTARAATLDLAPAEEFWFEHEGRRIHNLLIRPPRFDPAKRYPLFVLIHGGPHMQWQDQWVLRWNYHLLAAPGYVVLLTNYRGSTGYGEAFARAILGDPLRGPADEINAAADAAIARYPFIDAARQCAGGASYGGHLANWLQGTTTRYRCLVSHAGLVNLEVQWGTSDIAFSREAAMGGPVWEQNAVWREQNPIRLAANFRTPTLVTFGENDFRVPINNGLEYWTALQRMQVESRLVVYPDENHWILKGENSRHFYREVHDWLGRWLQPGSAANAP